MPLSNPRNMARFMKPQITKLVYRSQAWSQFGVGVGACNLGNFTPTGNAGPLTCPVHLIDLTCAPNYTPGQSTAQFPAGRFQMLLSNNTADATLGWNQDNAFVIESVPSNATFLESTPVQASMLSWVSLKMLFYAPLARPMKVSIMIIQLTRPELDPILDLDSEGTAYSPFARSIWQSFAQPFTYNPLAGGDGNNWNKYFKVMHRQTFIMNPKETTDTAATVYKQVNIFKRFNRRCRYDWNAQDSVAMNGGGFGQIVLAPTGESRGVYSTRVTPRARIFALIAAQASYNDAGFASTVHGSFDYVCRTCHHTLAR